MHSIPVSQAHSPTSFLTDPLRALSVHLAAWKARRRRRHDLALLMSMENHMLRDIGINPVEIGREEGSVLMLHPAVLATSMNIGMRGAQGDH